MLIKLHIKSDRQNTGLVPLTFPHFTASIPTRVAALAGVSVLGRRGRGGVAGARIRVLLLIFGLLLLLRGTGQGGRWLLALLLRLL